VVGPLLLLLLVAATAEGQQCSGEHERPVACKDCNQICGVPEGPCATVGILQYCCLFLLNSRQKFISYCKFFKLLFKKIPNFSKICFAFFSIFKQQSFYDLGGGGEGG
jgi:hypothetical protein